MITKFKIFENIAKDENDLADQFSQEYIEDYWKDNFKPCVEDAIYSLNLWNYVDEAQVKEKLISDIVSITNIQDKRFNTTDYIYYIKNNILNLVMPDLVKYRIKNNLGISYEKILDNIMNKDELIELIIDNDKSNDFIQNYFEEKWDNSDAEQTLIDIHGKSAIRDQDTLYNYLEIWINKKQMVEDYIDIVDFNVKYDYLIDWIPDDINIQNELIEMNTNNVFALFDVINEDENKSICKDYKFQKLYIEKNNQSIEESIKKLYERFGLNEQIKKEYKDYMYLIMAQQYNL